MKILILTNHSYMLYRFRRELIAQLQKEHEVVLSMPFVGHEEDFRQMGLRCIETQIDRRGINPKTDLKLLLAYRKLLRAEQPDLVITYSIKPNIYAGLVCSRMGIPFCANVQGLGSAFQRKGLAQFVTLLYKTALKRARVVFFENEGNAREFVDRRILTPEKITVLPGAGINDGNVRAFIEETGVKSVHASARSVRYDKSVNGNDEIFFGGLIDGKGVPEDEYKVTDPVRVNAVLTAIGE